MLRKIISGGQTGVDRGALEACIDMNFPYGGYVPKGRLAEDGKIPKKFKNLKEMCTKDYPARTYENALASDGTIIFIQEHFGIGKGSLLTQDICVRLNKPHIIFNLKQNEYTLLVVLAFIEIFKIKVLNMAGSRESSSPGIQKRTRKFVKMLIENRDGLLREY